MRSVLSTRHYESEFYYRPYMRVLRENRILKKGQFSTKPAHIIGVPTICQSLGVRDKCVISKRDHIAALFVPLTERYRVHDVIKSRIIYATIIVAIDVVACQ